MNSETHIIIIDDDERVIRDPLYISLKRLYTDVVLINDPTEGIEYIKNNLNQRNIIILDYKFATDAITGKDVLQEIRTISRIIPVIIWTANGDQLSDFSEFIDNRAFAIVGKSPYHHVLDKIKEAEIELINSLEGALEEWITIQEAEKLDQPYLITAGGKSYTLRELLSEIRLQTKFGRELEKDLVMLTIDLLLRKKQVLK